MPFRSAQAPGHPHYSVWLIPDRPASRRLTQFINETSRMNGTVPFPPHITAVAGIVGRPKMLRMKLVRIMAEFPPFQVRAVGVGSSQAYYRSLFLRIASNLTLTTLRRRLLRALGGRPRRMLAHLSLVYGY